MEELLVWGHGVMAVDGMKCANSELLIWWAECQWGS